MKKEKNFDVVVFGSITLDIFVLYDDLIKKQIFTEEKICFPWGSKVDIKNFLFKTGGGGTNTSIGFVKQGLKVSYYGSTGKTLAFKKDFIIKELKSFGVFPFIFKKKGKITNTSIILGNPQKDRTVLAYRGASELLTKKDIVWNELNTKWFYLAPLSGKMISIFKELVVFAKKNKILIAVNLGNSQISLPLETLFSLLKKIDVLFLNYEEVCLLINNFCGKVNIKTERELFQKLKEITQGIIIITKGKRGVSIFDQKYIYQAKPLNSPEKKIVDLTGAGDAFSSGFMSSFIRNKDIIKAIQLGIANSYSCIQFWGAKDGLLKKGDSYDKVEVKKFLL